MLCYYLQKAYLVACLEALKQYGISDNYKGFHKFQQAATIYVELPFAIVAYLHTKHKYVSPQDMAIAHNQD